MLLMRVHVQHAAYPARPASYLPYPRLLCLPAPPAPFPLLRLPCAIMCHSLQNALPIACDCMYEKPLTALHTSIIPSAQNTRSHD